MVNIPRDEYSPIYSPLFTSPSEQEVYRFRWFQPSQRTSKPSQSREPVAHQGSQLTTTTNNTSSATRIVCYYHIWYACITFGQLDGFCRKVTDCRQFVAAGQT